MPKVDKKNKKDNEEKDFAHAVISCEEWANAKPPRKVEKWISYC